MIAFLPNLFYGQDALFVTSAMHNFDGRIVYDFAQISAVGFIHQGIDPAVSPTCEG